MGEYAGLNGHRVKIGTCECMYYLRWDDRSRVESLSGNVSPCLTPGMFFRLPYPDEDEMLPGEYTDFNRGYRMGRTESDGTTRGEYWRDWQPDDAEDMELGLIQLRHESGLIFNVKCHHGIKLPDVQGDARPFWNGKSWSFELAFVKHVGNGVLRPTYHCRWCSSMWSTEWDAILPFCGLDKEMLRRLESYSKTAR